MTAPGNDADERLVLEFALGFANACPLSATQSTAHVLVFPFMTSTTSTDISGCVLVVRMSISGMEYNPVAHDVIPHKVAILIILWS